MTNFIYTILLSFRYRRSVILQNVNATKVIIHDPESIKLFLKNYYRFLASLIVETLHLSMVAEENLHFKNIEESINTANQQSILLMASHYGNWEMACTLLPTATDLPCYGVYKPLKNKWMDKWLLRQRSSKGLRLVPLANIAKVIAHNEANKIRSIYIFIADQNPNSASKAIWAEFLGIKTAFANGSERMLQKYDIKPLYMAVRPNDRQFSYVIDFIPMDTSSDTSITQQYADLIATQIKENPHCWLWSHKRWKRSGIKY